MAVYDREFVRESMQSFTDMFKADAEGNITLDPEFEISTYSVVVADGFKVPPMLQIARFMDDTDDREKQDFITKYCIQGRLVKVLLDEVEIFSFQMNNITDAWEAIQKFDEHPLAYKFIINAAVAFVIKKWSPQRKRKPEPVAAKTRN